MVILARQRMDADLDDQDDDTGQDEQLDEGS
jgi:hypothetical protein